MKPIDITSDSYAEYNEDSNKKVPNFKIDLVRISKYKGYTQNWSDEVFVVSKMKSTVPCTYVISDLNEEKIAKVFMKKNCKKLVKKIQNKKRT